ncbi:hypothetical protein L1049_011841 [Liquidambar formosana]|uniref:Bromo domain-containing protein n=1 Tax=Liquidambar formosana TaxID=63359 RepID=A0AAP0RXL3_LIQFO
MAKEENTCKETWSTWEELLLACAVKRHGFKDWDSVAMEIQTRSSLPHLLTSPQDCKNKYQDLKRRFTTTDSPPAAVANDGAGPDDKVDNIPWLDELRKLRVAELRQEVHRSDVSILSLQLKVKKLKEERERSLKESDNDDEKPDLEKDSKEDRSETDKKDGDGEPEKSSSEPVAGKLVSGEESDRDNQSVNESNSTGTKGVKRETGGEDAAREPGPVQSGSGEPGPVSRDSKPVGEDSYNESSDSIAKDLTVVAKKAEDSSELRDSAGESKRGEEGGRKENSDVQSSASLSRKTRRAEEISGGNSGEQPEGKAGSRAIKRISVKSQPFVEFLEMIRSHKHGSLFERRLQSQETDNYKNIVRQHMDLETIQKRLDEGSYSSSTTKFYRDMLLLFNNAIVYFPKPSAESIAAYELRNLVSNEMDKQTRRSRSDPSPEPNNNPSPPIPPQPRPDLERSDSLLAKHKSSAPIIVCRKRSSISAKSSSTTKKDEQKPVVDVKPPVKASPNLAQEQSIIKLNPKDRTVTGVRSSRRNNKTVTATAAPNKNQSTSTGSDKADTPKAEKKKKDDTSTSVVLAKKRSAADFLKRIKQNSPLDKLRSAVNDSKSTRGSGGGGGGSGSGSGSGREQKRKVNEKRDGRKDKASRQSGGGKHAKDENQPVEERRWKAAEEGGGCGSGEAWEGEWWRGRVGF